METALSIIIFSALLSVGLSIISVYGRGIHKSVFFNLLSIAVSIYVVGNYLEFTSLTEESSIVGVKFAYAGMPFIAPLWYLCVREFCGVEIKSTRLVLAMMLIPAIISFLAITWENNGFLFTSFGYDSHAGQTGQLYFTKGPLYNASRFYLYAFSLMGIITILMHYKNVLKSCRKQILLFLASVLIPLANTLSYEVTISGSLFNLTPIILSSCMVLFAIALSRYGRYNFSSMIKDGAIESLEEGILIFNKEGVHIKSNKSAANIFPQTKKMPVGTPIQNMGYLPFSMSDFEHGDHETGEFMIDDENAERTYSFSILHVGNFIVALICLKVEVIHVLPHQLELALDHIKLRPSPNGDYCIVPISQAMRPIA